MTGQQPVIDASRWIALGALAPRQIRLGFHADNPRGMPAWVGPVTLTHVGIDRGEYSVVDYFPHHLYESSTSAYCIRADSDAVVAVLLDDTGQPGPVVAQSVEEPARVVQLAGTLAEFFALLADRVEVAARRMRDEVYAGGDPVATPNPRQEFDETAAFDDAFDDPVALLWADEP